jgi:hypothetical protein
MVNGGNIPAGTLTQSLGNPAHPAFQSHYHEPFPVNHQSIASRERQTAFSAGEPMEIRQLPGGKGVCAPSTAACRKGITLQEM